MAKNQSAGIKTVDLPENGGLPAFLLMKGVEIAEEMKEERNRLYCLATSIVTQLKPKGDGDSPQPIALGLAELLETMLGIGGQEDELIDLLSTGSPSEALAPLGAEHFVSKAKGS
jgi:hypothetical protein